MEFTPLVSSNPVVVPATEQKLLDSWALTFLKFDRQKKDGGDYAFNMHVVWSLGRMVSGQVWEPADPPILKDIVLKDVLSLENIQKHPEIAGVAQPFFDAVKSVSGRIIGEQEAEAAARQAQNVAANYTPVVN